MALSADLPVVGSHRARVFFLVTAIVTAAIMFQATWLGGHARSPGLTPIYFTLFTELDYWGANSLLLILIGALFFPERLRTGALLRALAEHPNTVAAATAIVLSAGAWFVYQHHPLAMDEYAPLFQSRVFAAGHLHGQFPAPLFDWLIPENFQNFFAVSRQSGSIASGYWPSFALLLTPFSLLGIPWACNPVLSALTVIVIHRLALRMFDDQETAGLAILLAIASPVFFASGISYYSMPAHLLANSLFVLLLTDPTPRRAFLAGLVGSVALTLHNPVPHMLFALPWIIWLTRRPGGLRLLGSMAAGYTPLCGLLGVGWFWFLSGLRHANPASLAGDMGGAFAFPNADLLLARLIGLEKTWVWAVPGSLILCGLGAWRCWNNQLARLLLASAACTSLGYLFVAMDQGHGWGFRYFHSAWMILPLLGAAALRTRAEPAQDEPIRTFVVACALLTLVFGVGVRAWQIHDFISRSLGHMPAYAGTGREVVIIDPRFADYAVDLVQNDPFLRGNVIRMITHGRNEDEAMMHEHFPDLHRAYADKYGTVWSAEATGHPK